MTTPADQGDPIDHDLAINRELVLEQAAALAEHLQRSGVQWLPKACPEQVKALTQWMSASENQGSENQGPENQGSVVPPASQESAAPIPVSAESRDQGGIGSAPPGQATSGAANSPLQEALSSRPRLQPVAPITSAEQAYPGEVLAPDERQIQLDRLHNVVSVVPCAVLASCRKQTVFGEGSPTPRVAFFGEAPGADEDRSGRPFVGKAGQLLTKMIEACQFQRSDVYIFNTVKCRPPGNRNPEPDEINHCREYYQQQLAILRPEYIVCLGAVSAQELLQSKLSVGRLRGTLHRYFESKVIVTYHPAYLLRNPSAKKAAWEDLQIMLHDANIKY